MRPRIIDASDAAKTDVLSRAADLICDNRIFICIEAAEVRCFAERVLTGSGSADRRRFVVIRTAEAGADDDFRAVKSREQLFKIINQICVELEVVTGSAFALEFGSFEVRRNLRFIAVLESLNHSGSPSSL
jgi:hypothetical protein